MLRIKKTSKLLLFILAIFIGGGSLWFSNDLVIRLQQGERAKIELWAEAMREIQDVDLDGEISLIVYKILQENTTIPVILVGENNKLTWANLDSAKAQNEAYVQEQLVEMKNQQQPIVINYAEGHQDILYYKDSLLLTQLSYYPFIQFGVVALFILVSFFAFRNSQRADENQLWVGMSKETAHQLGTPISSLMAWIEILKLKDEDDNLITEVENDVKRLETITERFSRIGSTPELATMDVISILTNSVNYLKNRTSRQVSYILQYNAEIPQFIPLNKALFEWVIENLCKNAIDAMRGAGQITITVTNTQNTVLIDIKDTGKGIPKRDYKTIFRPGFSTKKRGWGLGLSLARRIIENYHRGKIYVKQSELGSGTTFRILLRR